MELHPLLRNTGIDPAALVHQQARPMPLAGEQVYQESLRGPGSIAKAFPVDPATPAALPPQAQTPSHAIPPATTPHVLPNGVYMMPSPAQAPAPVLSGIPPEHYELLVTEFEKFRQLTERRLLNLQNELTTLKSELTAAPTAPRAPPAAPQEDQLSEAEKVERAREQMFAMQRGLNKPPAEKPIDRNGVAPKDVQLDKLFSFAPGGNAVMNTRR